MQDLLTTLWAETGSTILFVTHDMDEAVLLADRILVMDRGSIAEEISLSAVRPRRLLLTFPRRDSTEKTQRDSFPRFSP